MLLFSTTHFRHGLFSGEKNRCDLLHSVPLFAILLLSFCSCTTVTAPPGKSQRQLDSEIRWCATYSSNDGSVSKYNECIVKFGNTIEHPDGTLSAPTPRPAPVVTPYVPPPNVVYPVDVDPATLRPPPPAAE